MNSYLVKAIVDHYTIGQPTVKEKMIRLAEGIKQSGLVRHAEYAEQNGMPSVKIFVDGKPIIKDHMATIHIHEDIIPFDMFDNIYRHNIEMFKTRIRMLEQK